MRLLKKWKMLIIRKKLNRSSLSFFADFLRWKSCDHVVILESIVLFCVYCEIPLISNFCGAYLWVRYLTAFLYSNEFNSAFINLNARVLLHHFSVTVSQIWYYSNLGTNDIRLFWIYCSTSASKRGSSYNNQTRF